MKLGERLGEKSEMDDLYEKMQWEVRDVIWESVIGKVGDEVWLKLRHLGAEKVRIEVEREREVKRKIRNEMNKKI